MWTAWTHLQMGELLFTTPTTYHPCCITSRDSRPSQGVLEEDLSVHQIDNLWACSAAVLPSAGTANLTFSLLCLLEQRALPSILRKLA
jgi:choline dehydrogenase-like flavoprotein